MSALYTQADVSQLVRESVKGLLDARRAMGKGAFTDADRKYGTAGNTGVAASLQGIRTVLNALAALQDDQPLWEAVSDDLPSLMEEWSKCVADVSDGEYTSAPYSQAILRELFEEEPCVYVDTVSWVLSTAVLVNYMLREGGAFDRFPWATPLRESGLLEKTRGAMHASVKCLLDAQSDDGGWSWRTARPASEDGTPGDAGENAAT